MRRALPVNALNDRRLLPNGHHGVRLSSGLFSARRNIGGKPPGPVTQIQQRLIGVAELVGPTTARADVTVL
jgi:hypothetical protein